MRVEFALQFCRSDGFIKEPGRSNIQRERERAMEKSLHSRFRSQWRSCAVSVLAEWFQRLLGADIFSGLSEMEKKIESSEEERIYDELAIHTILSWRETSALIQSFDCSFGAYIRVTTTITMRKALYILRNTFASKRLG